MCREGKERKYDIYTDLFLSGMHVSGSHAVSNFLYDLVLEDASAEEIVCMQFLSELKNRAFNKIELEDIDHFLLKYSNKLLPKVKHTIPENIVVGTKLNLWLATFATRTPMAYKPIVSVSLIQKGVDNLLMHVRKEQIFSPERKGFDAACWAYFLAAIRIGSLQNNDFQVNMLEKHYKRMNYSLRSCYEEEKSEVISAHLMIALFCHVTSQKHAFLKHTGFAKALINCLGGEAPDELNQAHSMIFWGHSSEMRMYSVQKIECELFRLFLSHFGICQEVFELAFPNLNIFFNSDIGSETHITTELDVDSKPALGRIFQGTRTVATCLMTARYFQKLFTNTHLSKSNILEALFELTKFLNLVLKCLGLSIETVPAIVRGYILQIQCFTSLLCSDFVTAKSSLTTALGLMDFWMLRTGFFAGSTDLVHQLHYVIASAVVLNLEAEYSVFWERLNNIFISMKFPFLLPNRLSHIGCFGETYSLCFCETPSPECKVPLHVLESLIVTNCEHMNIDNN